MSKSSPLKHKGTHFPYPTEEAYHKEVGGEVTEEINFFNVNDIVKGMINDNKSEKEIETAVEVLNTKVKKQKKKPKVESMGLVESVPVKKLGDVLPKTATAADVKAINSQLKYTDEFTRAEQTIKIAEERASGKKVDYNKLYDRQATGRNTMHDLLRHDASLKSGQSIWNLEKGDAIGELSDQYPEFNFEEASISAVIPSFEERKAYEESGGRKGRKHVRGSNDAVKVTYPGSDDFIIVEFDLAGFAEPAEGWDAVKIENFNKLTSFIDSHLTEDQIAKRLRNKEVNATLQESIRTNNLEPTDDDYDAQIEKKGFTSTDIFDETVEESYTGLATQGTRTLQKTTKPFGGYEKEIEEAKKQLIKENTKKAEVSGTTGVLRIEPTIEEIKQKALQNLILAEKNYVKTQKYDAWMDLHEDFDDWDSEAMIEKARKEGYTKKTFWEKRAWRENIRKEMKERYYAMKAAGRKKEAKTVLNYRANELQLKHAAEDLMEKQAKVKGYIDDFQNLNHEYSTSAFVEEKYNKYWDAEEIIGIEPSLKYNKYWDAEEKVTLKNGKVVPLEIWEQYLKDVDELQPLIDNFDIIQKKTTASINDIKDNSLQWNLIRRNYDDIDRFQEVLGYGLANLGVTAIYGVPKLLSFGHTGGDDEIIRWKKVVSDNRESFRKDVDFDRAFEDGNFGRFMLQSVTDQIPIYATLATGSLGLGILGASVFGDKWAEMTMEERATGDFNSITEKWFKSLGFAAAEIVLDYAITVPIMRNAKNMMFSGGKKALLDNTTKSFIKQNAGKSLVFSPALESVSESATQAAQNLVDGKPILEGMDHAAFLGLTMGMGISYTGFLSGTVTSQFADHSQMQEVRDNITEMQAIANTNTSLMQQIITARGEGKDVSSMQQEIKDNKALLDNLEQKNETIVNEVQNNIKTKLTPKAYRGFLANELLMETVKIEAQKIYDGNLPQSIKDKKLKELLNQFNAYKSGAKYFKDTKTFGSEWGFVLADQKKLKTYTDAARIELQNEGQVDVDEKKVTERAREVWAKEQARESNKVYADANIGKDYTSFETIDEAVESFEFQIQQEIDAFQKNIDNNVKGFGLTVAEQKQAIKELELEKADVTKALKSGNTYGVTHIDLTNGESMALSVVETQAKAERFETRTHEGGHQVFWNALQAGMGNQIFNPMAEQIIDWTSKNDEGMFKRIMLRTGNGAQGASEIVSVFLEEVGDGKFDIKKNKGFTNLWGLMSNDAITKTTGKDFEFDFSGETDVMNFLITLGKKIKAGTLTRADEKAIRKEFSKTKADKKAKAQFSRVYQEVETMKPALISTNSKKKRDAALMIAYTLENEVDRRLPVLEGINQEDKADIVNNFLFDEKRGLMALLQDYDPQINDSVMGYLNSFVPRTKLKLLDARLMEFYKDDPRFGNIIQSMQQEGVMEKVEKQTAQTTPKKRERVIVEEKVALETFGETALQNEIRADVITLGVEDVNTYLDVKKNTVSHRKFVGIKDAKGKVVKQIEITKEYKAKQKKLEVDAIKKYKKQGLTEKEAKKQAKKDHGIVELKSLRIPTGKYYPILEKIAKMYGVDPLRLIREQDLTTTMRKSAQDYILPRREEHIVSLPEGTTRAGDPTGIATTALGKAFFAAGGRMKFKTTGTGKGLKEQAKQRIDPNNYLAIFGLIPRARVNNTSVDPALRSQVIQTAVIAIDQAVRQEKDALELTKERVDQLKDGKGAAMFSQEAKVGDKHKNAFRTPHGFISNSVGSKILGIIQINRPSGKTGILKPDMVRDLYGPYNENETGAQARDRVIKKFLEKHPQYYNVLRTTMSGGITLSMFQTTAEFELAVAKPKNVDQKIIKRVYFHTDRKFTKKTFDLINTEEFINNNNGRLDYLLDLFLDIESYLADNPKDVFFFEEMLKDTQNNMGSITRIATPFLAFPIDINGDPVFDEIGTEEHSFPQVQIGRALLAAALIGDVKNQFKTIRKSYMQMSLRKVDDDMLKPLGLNNDVPNIYFTDIAPRLESGELKLPDGYAAFVRYAFAGIDLNMYQLVGSKQTVAEFFGVGGMEVKLGNQMIIDQLSGKIDPMFSREMNKVDLKEQINENKKLNKAIQKARTPQYSQEPKGITVLDFDDTLATTESLVRFTAPDGTKGTLNAEQYASQYQDLLEQKYKFDFTEFDKVVKAKLAPLFQKALKLQGKFGPENMFILTARPPAAQKAIRDFLKANGLNIPLKNITGLGNSTAEAKALWIADKVADGYNDFYFADDALQNVQAVKNMLDQFDVKSKVQQAKVQFSQDMNTSFNDILENITGVESKKRFSAIKARKRGASKGKFRFFIPPSHEDFVGLLYNFMGKGKEGNAHRDFWEQSLIKPLNRAYRELNAAKQSIANDFKSLNKEFEDVRKKLLKKTPDGDFTYQDAIRIYLWTKHGYDVPGLNRTDQAKLTELVMSDPSLQAYAETLNTISKQDAYVSPTENWETGDIRVDLDDATGRIGRDQFFTEFNENVEIIFSEENFNKIEAAFGASVVSAIKDILYRTKTGRNRPSGQNELTNRFMNYLNGSVGATMFFNIRSAVLQQMSIVNFINYADNNIFAAAKAFANQPQYYKDWATIFNSDFMKQRRGGIKTDVNGAELAASLRGAKNTPRALIAKLLEIGFLPTQIGDNIAIATGGAPFYRNRINTYLKQGFNQKEAESKAWTDFQVLAEATQQSARPDMVSQQQASPLGKIILAFQNVTSQFNRLGKKAFLDIKNRRITPGNTTQFQSDVSNTSRILYYFAMQNLIFYSLQTALFAAMFDDNEDDERMLKKRERMINGSIDSVLRGAGVWGAVISTLKNMAIKWHEQRDKSWNRDESAVLMEMLNVSPPLGIKARKVVNAERTLNYNKNVIKEMETFDIDNPMWSTVTNYVEAITNIPLNRIYNKAQNVRESLNNKHSAFQRALMFSGWSKWNLGIGDSEKIKEVKETIKEKKKIESKKKAEIKKEERKTKIENENKAKIEANKKLQEKEKKEGKKDIKCAAISKSGERCRTTIEPGQSYCTIHEEVEQNKSGKKVQCKKMKQITKKKTKQCGMMTSNKSGFCYYHD